MYQLTKVRLEDSAQFLVFSKKALERQRLAKRAMRSLHNPFFDRITDGHGLGRWGDLSSLRYGSPSLGSLRSAVREKTELRRTGGGDNVATMFDWSDCSEVTASPETVSGAFVFRGTRVPVRALFENLEDGATVDDFLQWFPGVGREQVDAVLEFAAHSLEPALAG